MRQDELGGDDPPPTLGDDTEHARVRLWRKANGHLPGAKQGVTLVAPILLEPVGVSADSPTKGVPHQLTCLSLLQLVDKAVHEGRLRVDHAIDWKGLIHGLDSNNSSAGLEQLAEALSTSEAISVDPDEILQSGAGLGESLIRSLRVTIHISNSPAAFALQKVSCWQTLKLATESGCSLVKVKAKGTAHNGWVTVGHISNKNQGLIASALKNSVLRYDKEYHAQASQAFDNKSTTATSTIEISFAIALAMRADVVNEAVSVVKQTRELAEAGRIFPKNHQCF